MSRIESRTDRLWALPMLALVTVPAVLGISSLNTPQADMQSPPAAEGDGRMYGEPLQIGNGNVRSYVELRGGEPVEIGVAFSEKGLENLPAGNATHEQLQTDPHANMSEYLLPLPTVAAQTPFRMIELDWNPGGHEPAGVYTLPHFDFHFYTITKAERDAIDPADPLFQKKTENLPAEGYLPKGYVAPMLMAVPRMGLHWIDPTSPELNGQKFTRTFIYGSWDGRTIFWEPMVTREFILSKPNFQTQVVQPQRVATPSSYPSGYSVRWDAESREYRIALTGLSKRAQ